MCLLEKLASQDYILMLFIKIENQSGFMNVNKTEI